jgi:hypothetical protein
VKTKLITKLALAAMLATPMLASAESQLVNGAGSASARLNFSVVIPRVLFLGVGTMTTSPQRLTNAAIDSVSFIYSTPTNVGTGAAPDSITVNGVVAAATLGVAVYGNNGQISLSVTNPTNLVGAIAGNTDVIPFTSITATSSDAANLPAPQFGGAAVAPALMGASRITNRAANWTYAYANTANVSADTYSGQATYTATMP